MINSASSAQKLSDKKKEIASRKGFMMQSYLKPWTLAESLKKGKTTNDNQIKPFLSRN